jgi:hypothetical protein
LGTDEQTLGSGRAGNTLKIGMTSLLQIRDIETCYGPSQELFRVSFDVGRLALLPDHRSPGNGGPLAPRRMATSLALQIEAR